MENGIESVEISHLQFPLRFSTFPTAIFSHREILRFAQDKLKDYRNLISLSLPSCFEVK